MTDPWVCPALGLVHVFGHRARQPWLSFALDLAVLTRMTTSALRLAAGEWLGPLEDDATSPRELSPHPTRRSTRYVLSSDAA
jgi:hypothetical protein